ncbi:MAG TPA: hypothetical protein VF527_02335 [Pyrinomonadaceae bacterium]
MRFKTRHPDGNSFDGVIAHLKHSFVVLREEREFEFDGVVILAKKFVKGFRDGKYERCANQILRENGAIKKLRVPRWLDSCETIPQALATMMRRDIWPAVEIVYNEGRDSAFYLGVITGVEDEQFSIKSYDAAGKWEKNSTLDYDEIFKIEFDSRYCKHFNAHMKSKNGA